MTEGLPLWSQPQGHEPEVKALTRIALELAERAGSAGITVADVRLAAVQRGLLTGEERGRKLSYLGAVMRQAGLERTGEYRRSFIEKAHGNLNAVWRVNHKSEEAAA